MEFLLQDKISTVNAIPLSPGQGSRYRPRSLVLPLTCWFLFMVSVRWSMIILYTCPITAILIPSCICHLAHTITIKGGLEVLNNGHLETNWQREYYLDRKIM